MNVDNLEYLLYNILKVNLVRIQSSNKVLS